MEGQRKSPTVPSSEAFKPIADVPLTLRAELDRRLITFRALLELNAGSIITLSRPAGENVDIYADDVCIGSGEILVNDSAFAVRLADLAGAQSRRA